MTTQIAIPATGPRPGSLRAQTSAAAAVIAIAAAIAGSALLGGIATGSSIEAPAEPGLTTPTAIPNHDRLPQGGGGLGIPLNVN